MHFLWLCDLIDAGYVSEIVGVGEYKAKYELNELTSNHFSLACQNVYKKIGVPEMTNLINRFYLWGENDG